MSVSSTQLYKSSTTESQSNERPRSSGLASDFDTFLGLLVTELQNQNPTDPMDTTSFIDQLVGFAQVGQQVKTNDTLDTVSGTLGALSIGTALSYVGSTVTVAGEKGPLGDDSDGIDWIYDLHGQADTVTLTITDDDGNTVYTTQGDTESGLHHWTWNGKNTDGESVDPGVYTLKIEAKDADGTDVEAGIAFTAMVTAVDTSDGTVTLELDGKMRVSLDTLQKVKT